MLGSIAQLLSPEIQQKCQKASAYGVFLFVGWIFSGLFTIGWVGFEILQKRIFWGIVYSIIMIIILVRLYYFFGGT